MENRMRSSNICLIRVPEYRDIRTEVIFEEIKAKNFLEQIGDRNLRFRNHLFQVNVLNLLFDWLL